MIQVAGIPMRVDTEFAAACATKARPIGTLNRHTPYADSMRMIGSKASQAGGK